ncbi:MAG: amino acid permease [Sarcina sp.]
MEKNNIRPQGTEKTLTLMGFFSITASMVMAVYEYPTFATSGFSLVFYLIFAGLLWFIPVALCAAEMATTKGWEEGGVFTWTGKSLNERMGFAHIFFQWFQITVGFVPMLYFIIGSLSYVLNWPELNSNPYIKLIAMLIIFWGLTFSQLGGTKYTARIAKTGFIIGILIPAIILIGLGIYYIVSGQALNIVIDANTAVPDFRQLDTLVVFVSFILSYMGVESSAVHVHEMINPKRDYPLAMLMLVIVAIILNTLGGLTIASAIPTSKLNLSSGIIQTYMVIIALFTNATWPARLLAFLLTIGVMAEVSSWVVGPSHGMFNAAQHGILPKFLAKENKKEVPTNLIFIQGLIVTFWCIVLTLGGGSSGNMSFFTSMSLTVVIYLAAYLIFFTAYFFKVFKHKEITSFYNVPGGKIGKVIVAGVGLLCSLFALIISFVPPSTFTVAQSKDYEIILIVGWVIVLIIPFVIYGIAKKRGSISTSL